MRWINGECNPSPATEMRSNESHLFGLKWAVCSSVMHFQSICVPETKGSVAVDPWICSSEGDGVK
jgi:hypothetical protein